MTSSSVTAIHSRDNAFVKDLRRLAQDTTAYRKQGRVWLEGDHLCRAALARGLRASVAVFSESFWPQAQVEYARAATKFIVLADALFADVSGLESPAAMGFILDLPAPASLRPNAATVVLDRVQDAGNVGSILRSASAFGFRQVAAIKGSAALWSPKVLRAGMGAHFALDLIEGLALDDLAALPDVTLSEEDVATIRQVGDNRGCMKLKGASAAHEGADLPDNWPVYDDVADVAKRWSIDPRTDLAYSH